MKNRRPRPRKPDEAQLNFIRSLVLQWLSEAGIDVWLCDVTGNRAVWRILRK